MFCWFKLKDVNIILKEKNLLFDTDFIILLPLQLYETMR